MKSKKELPQRLQRLGFIFEALVFRVPELADFNLFLNSFFLTCFFFPLCFLKNLKTNTDIYPTHCTRLSPHRTCFFFFVVSQSIITLLQQRENASFSLKNKFDLYPH